MLQRWQRGNANLNTGHTDRERQRLFGEWGGGHRDEGAGSSGAHDDEESAAARVMRSAAAACGVGPPKLWGAGGCMHPHLAPQRLHAALRPPKSNFNFYCVE